MIAYLRDEPGAGIVAEALLVRSPNAMPMRSISAKSSMTFIGLLVNRKPYKQFQTWRGWA